MERDAETRHEPEVLREPDLLPAASGADGLLDRIGLIESQPLDRRAQGFEQLHEELLHELQRSDAEGA